MRKSSILFVLGFTCTLAAVAQIPFLPAVLNLIAFVVSTLIAGFCLLLLLHFVEEE